MLIAFMSQYFFGIAICTSSLFLVLLVLVQRGRGGGLTGALGGPGGQSAFGTKAGDLFTKITIGVAAVWIFLCASAVFFLKTKGMPTLDGNAATSNRSTIGGTDDTTTSSSGTTDGTGSVPPAPVDAETTIFDENAETDQEASGENTSEATTDPTTDEANADENADASSDGETP